MGWGGWGWVGIHGQATAVIVPLAKPAVSLACPVSFEIVTRRVRNIVLDLVLGGVRISYN